MAWVQIRLNTVKEKADAVGDLLFAAGCLSVTYTNAGATPTFELTPGATPYWRQLTLVGLFDATVDTDQLTAFLQSQPGFDGCLIHSFEAVEDRDWEREWMHRFHPMQFGERLWVCPSWCAIPDADACNVILDPGLAFGTGTHETTALCLEWLASMDLAGKTVLDFGCGSGILAIAAVKLGARRALGIDIDPQAIAASNNNAERNNVADRVDWYLADNAPAWSADVVVANILAGPLITLKEVICSYSKSNGVIALSGILDEQVKVVETAYAERLRNVNEITSLLKGRKTSWN